MRRRTRTALAALPLALTLALTGCGSDGGGDGVASAGGDEKNRGKESPADMDPDELMLKFARCLRENGVNVADPEPGEGVALNMDKLGVDEATAQKAMEACRAYDPANAMENDPISKELEEKLRTYARCMRKNGVEEFPDPVPGGGLQIDGNVMEEDPDYERAEKACKDLMPAGESGDKGLNREEG